MNFQETDIQVAIIALISAILGAIITAIINYYLQKNLEFNKQIKEKQKDVYYSFLKVLQDFKNSTDPNNEFYHFQDVVNQVCLYGDNTTSFAVKEYYEALIISVRTGHLLNEQDFIRHETKIINAMRSNLGLKKFDQFLMIKH